MIVSRQPWIWSGIKLVKEIRHETNITKLLPAWPVYQRNKQNFGFCWIYGQVSPRTFQTLHTKGLGGEEDPAEIVVA